MMRAALQSTQRVQLVLMATCAALLVMSQSPDDSRVYREALDELRIVEHMRFADLDWKPDRWEYWGDTRDAARDAKRALSAILRIDPDGGAYPDSNGWRYSVTDSTFVDKIVPGWVKLHVIREFMLHDRILQWAFVDTTHNMYELVKAAVPATRSGTHCNSCEVRFPTFEFDTAADTFAIHLEVWSMHQGSWTMVDTLLPVRMQFHSALGGAGEVTVREVVPAELWNHDAIGDPALPKLSMLWEDVRDMSIAEAARFLERQRAVESGSVVLLGIEVDERAAATGGPALLFALLAYLFVGLRHIGHLPVSVEGRREFAWFPWAVTNRAIPARVVAVGELLIVPAGTLILLVARATRTVGPETIKVSVALSCCALLLALVNTAQAAWLRRIYYSSTHPRRSVNKSRRREQMGPASPRSNRLRRVHRRRAGGRSPLL